MHILNKCSKYTSHKSKKHRNASYRATDLMLGTWVGQSARRPRALFIAPKSRNDGFHRRCRRACSGDLRELVCMQTTPPLPHLGIVGLVAKLQTSAPPHDGTGGQICRKPFHDFVLRDRGSGKAGTWESRHDEFNI